jgi:peptide/nickel transport system permease protein
MFMGPRTGRRDRRPRRSRLPLILLVALHALLLAAEPLAPYAPDEQHREFSYSPPTRLRLVDGAGRWHLTPFVAAADRPPMPGPQHVGAISNVRWFPRGAPYRVAGLVSGDRHLTGVEAPSHLFLLGTDRYGRDMLSRLLVGARLSLFAGALATAMALGLGVLVGGASGFFGGRLDAGLMWVTDAVLALPWIYLLLAARALLPLGLPPSQAFLVVVLLMGAIGWARPARLVRGVAMAERDRDYVAAARGCGATDLRLLARHVLPQASGVMLTQASIMVPRFVLGEVTLSFLGLGLGEPAPSLGTLAAGLVPPGLVLTHWWLAAPLVAMVLVFALYEWAAVALAWQPGSM